MTHCCLQKKHGVFWTQQFGRFTTRTPVVSALRSCTGKAVLQLQPGKEMHAVMRAQQLHVALGQQQLATGSSSIFTAFESRDPLSRCRTGLVSGNCFWLLYGCRNAYNMVLHKFGDRLYNGVAAALRNHLVGVAGKIEATQGIPFLKELKARWDDHNKSTQMIRDILMVSCRLIITTAVSAAWQQRARRCMAGAQEGKQPAARG